MLVSKYRVFLLNVLNWSILMLGIKIRTVLKSELNGLHEYVQHFNPRCNRSQNITVNKADTVLRDTLYISFIKNFLKDYSNIKDAIKV